MTPNAFADIGAEKSVIGALLQDATCLHLLDELRPEDFTCPEYAAIFQAAAVVRARQQPVDMQTVYTQLAAMDATIGADVLLQAVRYVPSTANADSYAAIVRERSRRRAVKRLCDSALETLMAEGCDAAIDAAMDGMRAMLGQGSRTITSAQVADKTFVLLESIANGAIKSIPTPLADLNYRLSGGLRKGEVTVLAAYTGQGKSALAQAIARHAAQNGFRTLLVSREMGPEQYGLRAFASITGLDTATLLNAQKLTPEQWESLGNALVEMGQLPIDFTFRCATVEDVRQEARRMKNLDLLIVDYLQILQTRDKFPNDNARVSHISRTIKEIALDLQIPVLALSQFSRPPRGLGSQRPKLSDLRDSGSIEQDADNIWLMWQPRDDDDPDIPPCYAGWCDAAENLGDRFLLLDVAKQRMGRLGVQGVCFSPQKMTFYSPEYEGV